MQIGRINAEIQRVGEGEGEEVSSGSIADRADLGFGCSGGGGGRWG
jgi:hypothetical protein